MWTVKTCLPTAKVSNIWIRKIETAVDGIIHNRWFIMLGYPLIFNLKIMKIKIYQILIAILLGMGITGCQKEFLAAPPNNVTTTDSTVFSNELQCRQYLANIYNSLPSNQLNRNNGQLADGCFESEQGKQWSHFQEYNVNA